MSDNHQKAILDAAKRELIKLGYVITSEEIDGMLVEKVIRPDGSVAITASKPLVWEAK